MESEKRKSKIIGYKLEVFWSEDFDEARDVALWLKKRGYEHRGFKEHLTGEQFKTYARITCEKGKQPVERYFVEFLSPYGA